MRTISNEVKGSISASSIKKKFRIVKNKRTKMAIKYKVYTAIRDIQRDEFQQVSLQMCKHTVLPCRQRESGPQQVRRRRLADAFGCKGNVVSNVIGQIYATIQEL